MQQAYHKVTHHNHCTYIGAMAGKERGGAEQYARFKQFDYKANSNLVLTAEQRTSVGSEPDGSAASLWGRMGGRMGDRVLQTKPEGIDERKTKKKRDANDDFDLPKKRKVRREGQLDDMIDAAHKIERG